MVRRLTAASPIRLLLVELTAFSAPTIFPLQYRKARENENPGDWRWRARACIGVETGPKRRRGEDLVRAGKWWHRGGGGVRGSGRRGCGGFGCASGKGETRSDRGGT